MDEKYLQLAIDADDRESLVALLRESQTRCYLSVQAGHLQRALTVEILETALANQQITVGLDRTALATVCERANAGKPALEVLVAAGKLPKPGQDAFVDYKIRPFSLDPEFTEDSHGRLDYHETHLIHNVQPGQIIGILHPAVPGTPGVTVQGETLAPPAPKTLVLRPGPGVDVQPPGDTFIAARKGRVVLEGNLLSVAEEFVVAKDVDFGVGNIEFTGFVQVRGDVLDGFNIRADKGLQIDGLVGACVLESNGNISLAGMTGHENSGKIRCGGQLTANYLHNVQVACEGDLTVKTECLNSTIRCNGRLSVGGRIVGGDLSAQAGIEAGQLGSDHGVKTYLTAGYDIQTLEQVRNIQELLHEVENLLRDARDKLAPHAPEDSLEGLAPAEQTRLRSLQDLWRKHAAKQEGLVEVLRSLEHQRGDRSQPQINVHKQIHPGSVICFDCRYQEIKEVQEGPLTMTAGPDGGLAVQPLQPFKTGAAAPDPVPAHTTPAPASGQAETLERTALSPDKEAA